MEEKKKNRGGRPRGRAFSDQISIRIETYLVEYARRTGNLSRYINDLIRADYEKNEQLKKEEAMKQAENVKRYYISTTAFNGSHDGLLHLQSEGISVSDLEEAKEIYKAETQYLDSNYEMSDNDGEGYYCSIFDKEKEEMIVISNSYNVM